MADQRDLLVLALDVQREVALLLPVLTHPAGFNVDLFGNLLGVNGTEDPDVWEVSWDRPNDKGHRAFKTAREALRFFCIERRRLEIGLEFERVKPSCAVPDVVSPHRPGPWITDVSPDRRSCKLLGYICVADFDIAPDTIASLVWEILDLLGEPERALQAGECDAINIGLYQGGHDIRVWKVHFR